MKKRVSRNNTNFPVEIYEELRKVKKEGTKYSFLKYHQNIVRHFVKDLDINSKGLLIKHSMGTGKSIVAVAIIIDSLLEADKNPYKIVVLLTKSLKENFKQNIIKYIRMRTEHEADFTLGLLPDSDISDWIDRHFNFVTLKASNMIKQVIKATEGFISADLKKLEKKMGRLVDTGSLDNTCLIVDEAHHLFRSIINGSANGMRLYDMVMRAKNNKVIFMTGTPIEDDPFTLVPCFNMLSGQQLFPEDYQQFQEYFIDGKTGLIKNRGKFQNRIFGLVSSVEYSDTPGKGAKIDGFSGEDLGVHFPDILEDNVIFVPMGQRQFQQYQLARENEMNEAKVNVVKGARLQKPKGALNSSYRQKSRQLSNFCPPSNMYGRNFSSIDPSELSNKECASEKIQALYDGIQKSEGISLVYSQFVGIGGLGAIGRFLQAQGWKLYNEMGLSAVLEDEEPIPDEEIIDGLAGNADLTKGQGPAGDKKVTRAQKKQESKNRAFMAQFMAPAVYSGGAPVKKAPPESPDLQKAGPGDADEIAQLSEGDLSPAQVRTFLKAPNFVLVKKAAGKIKSAFLCELKDKSVNVKAILQLNQMSEMDSFNRKMHDMLINDVPKEYRDVTAVNMDIKGLDKNAKMQLKTMVSVSGINKLNDSLIMNPSDVKCGCGPGDEHKNMTIVEYKPGDLDAYSEQLKEAWPEGVDSLKRVSERQKEEGPGQPMYGIGAKILLKKKKVKAVAIYDYTDGDIVIHESFIKAPRYREIFYNLYIKYAAENKEKSPFNDFVYFKAKKNSNLDESFYKQFGCAKIKESVTTILYRCNLNWDARNYVGECCNVVNGAGSGMNNNGLDSTNGQGSGVNNQGPLNTSPEARVIQEDLYFDGLKIRRYNPNGRLQIHDIDPKFLEDTIYYISSEDDDVFGWVVLSQKQDYLAIEDMYLSHELAYKPQREGPLIPGPEGHIDRHQDINAALLELIKLMKEIAHTNGLNKVIYKAPQDLIHDFLNNLGFVKLTDDTFVLDASSGGGGAGGASDYTNDDPNDYTDASPGTRDKPSHPAKTGTGSLGSFIKEEGIGGAPGKKAQTFAIISGKVSQEDRDRIVTALNSKDNIDGQKISVLLISATGAEGLDLHNVRDVFIFEPYWNRARVDQVKFRGARNNSHIDLPEAKQNVRAHILLSVAPKTDVDYKEMVNDIITNNDRSKYQEFITTDLELYLKSELSAITRDTFIDAIDEVSIECTLNGRSKCKVCKPNNKPLWHKNLRDDMVMKDACEPFNEEIIRAKEIEVDNHTFYYIEDPSANIFGVIAYEYNPDLATYVELGTDSPAYQQIVEKINPAVNDIYRAVQGAQTVENI